MSSTIYTASVDNIATAQERDMGVLQGWDAKETCEHLASQFGQYVDTRGKVIYNRHTDEASCVLAPTVILSVARA